MNSSDNIGIDSYSFHLSFGKHGLDRIFNWKKEMDLPAFFELARQLKVRVLQIDPVHIPGLDGPAFLHFKDMVKSYDFEIILGSFISLVRQGPMASMALKKYQKYIDACRVIDAHILRGVCGANRFRKNMPLEDQIKIVVSNLKKIESYMKDAGVVLALENHGTLQAHELVSIIKSVDSSAVKINLDNGNPLLCFEDPVKAFEIMAPHTVCLHFKDYKRKQTGYGMVVEGCKLGAGVIDLKEQLKIYKQACPDAKLCLELCIKKGEEKPLVIESLEFLRKALASME